MGTLLALASAVSYGLSDFLGGLVSRRAWYLRAALLGQVGGLVTMTALAPLFSTTVPATADLAWGGLSGVGTGLAMMFLFRGMSRGAMSIVVPTSAVGGVALPVLVGVVALGERPAPLAWAGIALALPALWSVSHGEAGGGHRPNAAVGDGLIASVGIAVQYLALAQAAAASGTWAVVAGRVTAVITIVALGKTLRMVVPEANRRSTGTDVTAAIAGVLAGLALAAYLFATRTELVAIAVVLSSLYPVIPVLLGITVLRERLNWRQCAGLTGALAATVLIATA
ncbi:MAG: multidrug DMT transporter permease [Actinobacteria bacterium]|nr:multidrug DMT transporter permease [Actinomycetota bacterium]